jgi:ferric-dicitrate binding protein FerR (iron transport regulator)
MSDTNTGPGDGSDIPVPNLTPPQGPDTAAQQRAQEAFRQRRIAGLLALAGRRRQTKPGSPDNFFVRQTMARIAAGPASPDHPPTRIIRRPPTASRVWVGSLAAVALMLVILVALVPSQTPPARLTVASGAVIWKPSQGAVGVLARSGQTLRDGFLETLTTDSSARVRFADGTELALSGAALLRLGFEGGLVLELTRGGLSADVTPQPRGHPMLVGTPEARMTVLGTRFLLEARARSTRLEVAEGLVRMERLSDGSATEVPARHRAVASQDGRELLTSQPTSAPVTAWRPRLRDQVSRGIWNPGNSMRPARLGSVPFEVPGETAPVLLQVCSLQPPTDKTGPVLLSPGARFLVRGSSEPNREVFVGVTARHPGGGLAGPYSARFIPTVNGPAGFFTAEVPVSALRPRMQGLPSSPEGMEMVDWWAGSRVPTNSVEIEAVELLPEPPATPGKSP